jgi:hypothetical protein
VREFGKWKRRDSLIEAVGDLIVYLEDWIIEPRNVVDGRDGRGSLAFSTCNVGRAVASKTQG